MFLLFSSEPPSYLVERLVLKNIKLNGKGWIYRAATKMKVVPLSGQVRGWGPFLHKSRSGLCRISLHFKGEKTMICTHFWASTFQSNSLWLYEVTKEMPF